MQSIRTENWNGYNIRFVYVNEEWCGVAKDISDALGYKDAHSMIQNLNSKYTWTVNLRVQGQERKMLILTEFGIYKAIFNSKKTEAESFQQWVFEVIKELRKSTGLEGFQVFRMMDKEHQKQAMSNLNHSLKKPVRRDFIKANTIANKAISTKHGYPKMVKKDEMTPEMLVEREEVLDDTVQLIGIKDKYDLDISVSESIYNKI